MTAAGVITCRVYNMCQGLLQALTESIQPSQTHHLQEVLKTHPTDEKTQTQEAEVLSEVTHLKWAGLAWMQAPAPTPLLLSPPQGPQPTGGHLGEAQCGPSSGQSDRELLSSAHTTAKEKQVL